MKKTLTILLFAVLIVVLFPVAALADGYDGSGGVIIDTEPTTSLQASIEALTAAANVTSLTITSDPNTPYTLSSADQTYIANSLSNLQILDVTSTVFFDADGDATTSDLIDGFFNVNSTIQSVSLASVTTVGDNDFAYCYVLTSLSLPRVTTAGNRFARSCALLTSINIPNIVTFGGEALLGCPIQSISLPNATTFGDNAFSDCGSLTSVNLPNATTFGYEAFSYCTTLGSISLPSATSFAGAAFMACTSLTDVDLPNATTFLGIDFSFCDSLTSITLPAATSIGDSTFWTCPLLTEVNLPSVTSIGAGLFADCPLAIELTLGSTLPTVDPNIFISYTAAASATVNVPTTTISTYDNDPQDTSGASDDGIWFGVTLDGYVVPSVPSTPTEQATNPQTGDSSSAYLWLLMLVPLVVVISLIIKRKSLNNL